MEPKKELQPVSPLARILIVEDEVLTRMVLAEELRDAGYTVFEASNADDAMALLKTSSRIDLVFSDVQMPGTMDGLELARRLRVDYPSLPVIISSAHPVSETVASFIPKPYRVDRVISTISQRLRLE